MLEGRLDYCLVLWLIETNPDPLHPSLRGVGRSTASGALHFVLTNLNTVHTDDCIVEMGPTFNSVVTKCTDTVFVFSEMYTQTYSRLFNTKTSKFVVYITYKEQPSWRK